MVEIGDFRGQGSRESDAPVLADRTGRRARALKPVARLTGALFVLWVLCLALAGLDILPVHRFLFAQSLIGQRPASLQPGARPAAGITRPAKLEAGLRRAGHRRPAKFEAGLRPAGHRRPAKFEAGLRPAASRRPAKLEAGLRPAPHRRRGRSR